MERAASAPDAGLPSAAASGGAPAPPEDAPEPSANWCAAEFETLPNDVCFRDAGPSANTLVIFLHGVIKLGTTWQWTQQRAAARAAERNGFAVLMPRGRPDIASRAFAGHITWPTSQTAQRKVEDEIVEEWLTAKRLVEQRRGAPFEKVFVFGFSNGAYYATSLAFRSRIPVDGYAVFAGGSAPPYLIKHPPRRSAQKPIYVGYGLKDRAHRDPEKLGKALRAIGWKSRAVARATVGHTMNDAQADEALKFLTESSKSASLPRLALGARGKQRSGKD